MDIVIRLSQKLLKVSNVCTHTCAKSTAAAKQGVMVGFPTLNAAITFYDFNSLNAYH